MQLCWPGSNHCRRYVPLKSCFLQNPGAIRNVGHITRVGTLHGQTFLWHSGFSSGSRRKLKPVVQRRFLASDINNDPAMSISIRIRPASIAADIHITGIFIHIVRNPYSHPSGILIHIAPESLFTWSGICNHTVS
jgi:hypothetical protein